MLDFHVAGSTGDLRAGPLASLLLKASATLISQYGVFFAQIHLRDGFALGCTPFCAQILCMKRQVQIGAQKKEKEEKRKRGFAP